MTDHICSNLYTFTCWGVLFFIILFVFLILISNKTSRKLLSIPTPILFCISVFIWLYGVYLYSIGYHSDHNLTFMAIVPRAIIASFRMFLVNQDLARVSNTLRGDNVYMIHFSLIHFAAAMTSVLWVMKLIGFRVRSFFRYAWRSLFIKKGSTIVNIFWGINEESMLLAQQIKNTPKQTISIFANTSDKREKGKSSKISLSYVFDVMSLSESVQNWIEQNDAYVTNCHYDLASKGSDGGNILAGIGMKKLGRFVRKASKVNFFFLSDNEDLNLSNSMKILADPKLSVLPNLTVYSHVRSTKMADIYDHYSQYSAGEVNARLKIVDSSLLSIAELKQNSKYHPVNYVSIDQQTATVTSPAFNSMVIGYGETGEEAFKFLYEFASFVDPQGKKVPFKCYVVDRHMDKMAASIRHSMPAIAEDEMTLVNAEIGTKAYWELVESTIKTLNYIIITVKDDNLGIQTAIDLFKTALQTRRNNLKDFAIYVRCYESQNFQKMSDLASKMTSANKGCGGEIIVFGRKSDIYTYELIINEMLLKQAKEFHKVYEGSDKDADAVWDTSFGNKAIDEKLIKAQAKDKSCTRFNIINDIDNKINQNYSNSTHIKTKRILLGLNNANIKGLRAAIDSRAPETALYATADKALQEKLLNVAKCEHIRWESSHKLMGYTYAPNKCIIQKHHNCLIPWENLDEETQSYDCNVVDTSIRMS